jgi:hypothetical protein
MRIASPERRWRAGAAPLIAGLIGWIVAGSVELPRQAAPMAGLPLAVRIIVTCVAIVIGVWLAARILRTYLSVSDEGLADHRLFRVVRVPWRRIASFEVDRPGWMWGGFCVTANCRDGRAVDLLSTRAYSRIPSAWHLDELQRILWSLDAAAATHDRDNQPPES